MPKAKVVMGWTVLLSCLLAMETGAMDIDLARYATAKENQIRDYAQSLTNQVPPAVWRFFDAVRVDDWETAMNLAGRISAASGRYLDSTEDTRMSPALRTLIWPPISEMIGTYEQFHLWNNKWLHQYGSEIIKSIPADSIYFGGTDPGRFVISALSKPDDRENQFYILTQNQLVDRNYLEYLGKLYHQSIYIPTSDDFQTALRDYAQAAKARANAGALKPGEYYQVDANRRLEVSGLVAVMEVNGLLTKIIFDKNPGHNFFVEESYPLDWMYPYLSPHGLIFQLHSGPLAELSGKDVSVNQDYWRKFTGELIGGWLDDKTRIQEICDFTDKTYLDKNHAGFQGDTDFINNDQAQKCFSKLRSSQAGMYDWRAQHTPGMDGKIQMQNAADLAFRQAYALCPYSPEAIFRYTQFLLGLHRPDDAFRIVKTSLRLDPDNAQLKQLMERVRKDQQ